MKKKILTIVISIAIIMAVCVMAGGLCIKPYRVPLASNTVTVRLPGEYEKNAIVRYNSKYVHQERDGYILTITLEKPGYYYVSVLGNDYILEWLDNERYSIDLLKLEKIQVNIIAFERGASFGIIVGIFVGVFTYSIGYIMYFKKQHIVEDTQEENSQEEQNT